MLIFADALVRSWKQVTKFKPAGAAPAPGGARRDDEASAPPRAYAADAPARSGDAGAAAFSLEGLIRDERGVRLAPESDD